MFLRGCLPGRQGLIAPEFGIRGEGGKELLGGGSRPDCEGDDIDRGGDPKVLERGIGRPAVIDEADRLPIAAGEHLQDPEAVALVGLITGPAVAVPTEVLLVRDGLVLIAQPELSDVALLNIERADDRRATLVQFADDGIDTRTLDSHRGGHPLRKLLLLLL